MSDVDNLQKIFTDATNKMKQRVGQLEFLLKEKEEKMVGLREELNTMTMLLNDANEGVKLWRETAENRDKFLVDYKDREQDAFGTVIGMIVKYMDDYELYRGTSNKYGGAILQGFKGLTPKKKTQYNAYIKKKSIEINNYVKRMKEGKV